MKLKKPVNQAAAVLRMLITRKKVSERDTDFNRFRGTKSDLNKLIDIKFEWKKFVNQFGTKSQFKQHYISDSDKSKAVELYNKINVKK